MPKLTELQSTPALAPGDLVYVVADGVSSKLASLRVANIAAMTAIAVPLNGMSVEVTEDGRGGLFVFDTSVTAAGNGGTTFSADDATTGSWVRRFDGPIAVEWFGDTAGDYAPALNAAFAAATATGIPYVDNYRDIAIRSQVVCTSNVTFRNFGRLTIDAVFASHAILCDTQTRFKWIGGEIKVTEATFNQNIILSQSNTKCLFRDIDIIDGGVDRYPLAPIRSLYNTRTRYENIDIESAPGIGFQSFEDSYCKFVNVYVESPTGSKSGIETNNGDHNIYIGCETYTPLNTATSAFSFNDKKSVLLGCISEGGAHSITVGHAAPYEANNSVVMGNIADSGATSGINVQATEDAAIVGNVVTDTITGIQGTTSSNRCTLVGNVVEDVSSVGVRAGAYWTVIGNVVDKPAIAGYRTHSDGTPVVVVGNVCIDGDSTAYQWGLVAGQINGILVGNFAGDSRGTPALVTGFKAVSGNLLVGNATDGNASFRQFDGDFSTLPNKDFSDTTIELGAHGRNLSGGTGSAGAGTQYVAVKIGANTYKILHDGTI